MTAMDVDHSDDEDTSSSIDCIPQLMERPMTTGENWYLLDIKWYEAFKLFLTDQSVRVNDPGPIDNGPLFKSQDAKESVWPLRSNLEEKTHYVLLPEEAWNLLVNKFSIVDKVHHTIRRQVIQQGSAGTMVEVYPVELKLCLYGAKDLHHEIFSRTTKLSDVLAEMKRIFKIAPEDNTQIWTNGSFLSSGSDTTSSTASSSSSSASGGQVYYSNVSSTAAATTSSASSSSSFIAPDTPPSSTHSRPKFTNAIPLPPPPPPPPANDFGVSQSSTSETAYLTSTLADLGVHSGSVLTVEVKNADGTWPSLRPKYTSLRSSASANCTPGLCGLMNLGNTCFMNSALQCMSNCPPLTEYFVSDEYIDDINEKNPLGMNGQVARAYATLIKAMWSGTTSCEAPRQFKIVLGRFAPQFSGFQQQDCQELMASLLDGLHEDLNRIYNKPYIEINTGIDQRPDDVVAAESWSNYKKRNDSIIIDTFHGLLKSTLVCPDCHLVSVTFDPFCYLSLPLPVKRERAIEVTVHRIIRTAEDTSTAGVTSSSTVDYHYSLIKLSKLAVPKEGHISDISAAVVKAVNEKCDDVINGGTEKHRTQVLTVDRLIVCDVNGSRFHKIFSKDDSYNHNLDDIHVFETIEGKISIPVYLREIKDDGTRTLFGQPFFINVDSANGKLIYDAVFDHCKIFFNLDNGGSNNIVTSSHEQNGDNDTDEGVTCDDFSSADTLFSLTLVNSFGSIDNEKLSLTSEIKLTNKIYLAADLASSIRSKYRDDMESTYIQRVPMTAIRNFYSNSSGGTRAPVSLSDCINQFTTTENLGADDPWYCPRCKKHQEATKKFDLWSLPKVFIIHLKRFSYSRFWRDKLDTLVDFPVSHLDMSQYVIGDQKNDECLYDLIAVANHYGGLGGGHYTAYAKNSPTQSWHYFDDSNVSPATEDNVVSKAAYVLFYQRREKSKN